MPNVIDEISRLQKPMTVANWWGAQKPQAMSSPLEEEELNYMEVFTSGDVDKELRIGRGIATPGSLSAEDKERVKKHFGDAPGAELLFVNYENRRRIIAHYTIIHPATIAYMMQLYRFSRDSVPILFIAERVYELFTGEEAFTGDEASRIRAAVDLLLVIIIGRALRAARPAAGTRQPVRALTDPIYDLPAEGGGMNINGRWYTEHALERMAPDTPAIRAELKTRAIKRLERMGITQGSPAYDKCVARALRKVNDPRGVPPSVVEAEISKPGSTNVRVITAKRGQVVVTVIPK